MKELSGWVLYCCYYHCLFVKLTNVSRNYKCYILQRVSYEKKLLFTMQHLEYFRQIKHFLPFTVTSLWDIKPVFVCSGFGAILVQQKIICFKGTVNTSSGKWFTFSIISYLQILIIKSKYSLSSKKE